LLGGLEEVVFELGVDSHDDDDALLFLLDTKDG